MTFKIYLHIWCLIPVNPHFWIFSELTMVFGGQKIYVTGYQGIL